MISRSIVFSLLKWKFAFHNMSPLKLLHWALDLPVLKPVRQWPPEPRCPGQLSFENIPLIGPKIRNFCTHCQEVTAIPVTAFMLRSWMDQTERSFLSPAVIRGRLVWSVVPGHDINVEFCQIHCAPCASSEEWAAEGSPLAEVEEDFSNTILHF